MGTSEPVSSFVGMEGLEQRMLLSASTSAALGADLAAAAKSSVAKLKIFDASGAEGSAANPGSVTFTVRRLSVSDTKVKVRYRVVTGSSPTAALAGADLQAVSGKLTFKAGENIKSITVPLIGDSTVESNKTFAMQLFKPKNAKLARGTAVGTIADDDGLPVITIDDISTTEGNKGTKTVFFTVKLSRASDQVVTVKYKTNAGSAIAPEDYIAIPLTTLTFQPGQTSKTIGVQIVGDTNPAQKLFEVFFVDLSAATNATIGDARGEGTIIDNDRPDSPGN